MSFIIVDGKCRMFSDENSVDEYKEELAQNQYMIVSLCSHNGFFFDFFGDIDAALHHFMREVCHSHFTEEDIKNDTDCTLCVREKNGRLTESWMSSSHGIHDTPLFKNYTEDKPRALKQLEEYFRNGNSVCLGWGDRAPVTYKLIETSRARAVEVNQNDFNLEDEDEKLEKECAIHREFFN